MLGEPPPLPAPYRRSPFQVALLLFATGGVYLFVWAYHVRRWSAGALERQDQPLWKSIALIVPIFNLFLMFDLGQMIKGVAWRAELPRISGTLPWLGIASFVIGALWKLPDPYWVLSVLDFVPLALMHGVFMRAELRLAGEAATPTKFHWVEWIVVVLGPLMWIFAVIGLSLPNESGAAAPAAWFGWVVLAAAVVALLLFARMSRGIVSESASARALTAAVPPPPSPPV